MIYSKSLTVSQITEHQMDGGLVGKHVEENGSYPS